MSGSKHPKLILSHKQTTRLIAAFKRTKNHKIY